MTSVEQKNELWDRITPSAYRQALSTVPTSVVVAAGMNDRRPIGMVIGTFSTVSMDPPLVGFFGDHRSSTLSPLLGCERITFSLLRQEDLEHCEAFRLPLDERFDHVPWHESAYATPAIDDALLTVHTRVDRIFDAGDHTCVLAEVLEVESGPTSKRPLVFYRHRLSRLDPGQLLDDELWQLGWESPE